MNKKGHVLNAVLLSLGLAAVLTIDPARPLSSATAYEYGEQVAALFIPVVLGALFPDVDTAFGRHRKTLHNLPVLVVFLAYPLYFGNLHYVWVGVATHYLLDVVGSKRGIALFYPLSPREYGFPTGVATSSKWADVVTVVVTAAEVVALAAVHYYVVSLDAGIRALAAFVGTLA